MGWGKERGKAGLVGFQVGGAMEGVIGRLGGGWAGRWARTGGSEGASGRVGRRERAVEDRRDSARAVIVYRYAHTATTPSELLSAADRLNEIEQDIPKLIFCFHFRKTPVENLLQYAQSSYRRT